MRSIEDKEKFIIGRAEGKSFPVLNKELEKSECSIF